MPKVVCRQQQIGEEGGGYDDATQQQVVVGLRGYHMRMVSAGCTSAQVCGNSTASCSSAGCVHLEGCLEECELPLHLLQLRLALLQLSQLHAAGGGLGPGCSQGGLQAWHLRGYSRGRLRCCQLLLLLRDLLLQHAQHHLRLSTCQHSTAAELDVSRHMLSCHARVLAGGGAARLLCVPLSSGQAPADVCP